MKRQEAGNRVLPTISIDKSEILVVGQNNRKNIGYAALSKIYYELGLDIFLANHARELKCEYNVNNIVKLLLFSRILAPASKKNTFEPEFRKKLVYTTKT